MTTKVAAMTQKVAQKSEEICRYQAEQTMVLNRVWDLVGKLGEIFNKAHL